MSKWNGMLALAAVVAVGSVSVAFATPAEAMMGGGYRGSPMMGGGYRGSAMMSGGYRGSAMMSGGYRASPMISGGYRGSYNFGTRPAIRPHFAFRTNPGWNRPQSTCSSYGGGCTSGARTWGGSTWGSNLRRPWVYHQYRSRPIIVTPAPTYVTPPPTYVAPAPRYVAPAPTYVTAAPTVTVPTYQAPAPAPAVQIDQASVANTCTCLKKEYTQDGQVVFQDVCSNEGLTGPAGQQVQVQPQQQYQR
jgi:hypothetical protein